MAQGAVRLSAARWVTSADPAGLLYGAIVSAAVLVTISTHADDVRFVGLTTAGVLAVYWSAHGYIETLSRQFEGDTSHFLLRLRAAMVHESSVLKGGAPAIVIYALSEVLGAETETAATLAAYFSVALLAAVGYLGAHQAGVRGPAMLLEVAGAASFGVVIVIAKTFLH